MKCMENRILKVSESLSISKVDQDSIMLTVNGHIKRVICEYEILMEVLQKIDGKRTYKEIQGDFLNQYTINEVDNFFQVLLEEEIIKVCKKESEVEEKVKVVFVGEGRLFEEAMHAMRERVDIVACIRPDQLISETGLELELEGQVYVIIPENLTYRKMIQINQRLVDKEIPFAIFHCDGNQLVIGPFVFPWRTACFSCLVTHHVTLLNEIGEGGMTCKDMEELVFSFPIRREFSEAEITYWANALAEDIAKVGSNHSRYRFIEREITVLPGSYEIDYTNIYRPISDCECCHAMNKGFVRFMGEGKNSISLEKRECKQKIRYSVGGFRSVDSQKAKEMIDSALCSADLKIQIYRVKDSEFDDIVPIYHSRLEASHSSRGKYFFKDQVSHGKGINEQQAYFSASFELFERLSAGYYGEKSLVRASAREVGFYGIDVANMARQIRNMNSEYERYSDDKSIDWVWGISLLTGESKLVPASMVFLSDAVFRGQFFGGSSSGLSAGATIEDAILQGLFELVEHDAWMIGQANQIRLPRVDINGIKNEKLQSIIQKLEERGYRIITRDYTNDIGIPVFRTWLMNPKNYTNYATNGFGASLSAELALERSITEAIQSSESKGYSKVYQFAKKSCEGYLFSPYSLYGLNYFNEKDMKEGKEKGKSILDYQVADYSSVSEVMRDTVQRIQKAVPNIDIVFVNLTREVFGIPVVRVIITGDFQCLNIPLMAVSPRMFEFQRKMGYTDLEPAYEDLYMGVYPH